MEWKPGNFANQHETISGATLRAVITAKLVQIVKAKPILSSTKRARSMLVDQKTGFHAKGWQDLPPAPFCNLSGLSHGVEAPVMASSGWEKHLYGLTGKTTFEDQQEYHPHSPHKPFRHPLPT
jgi:hypothetical protein